MKICSKCNQTKTEDEFPWINKNRQRADCRDCFHAALRAKYHTKKGNRICKVCNQAKSIDQYNFTKPTNKAGHATYSFACTDCSDMYVKQKQLKITTYNIHSGDNRRRRKYGMEPDEFIQMMKNQNGLCAICSEEPERGLVVDHNHSTGIVRGLLCHQCNTAIGLLKDNHIILAKATEYLKQ